MHSRAWWVVAKREFLERIRSKWFLVVTLLGPVLMIGVIVIPSTLAARDAQRTMHVVLLSKVDRDLADRIVESLKATDPKLEAWLAPSTVDEDELLARIKKKRLDGYMVIPADLLSGGQVVYHGANATNFAVMARMRAGLQLAVIAARAEGAGIEKDRLAALLVPVPFDAIHTTGEKTATSGAASFILGYIVTMILYVGILLYAINVMRSVLQEKTNRVVEIVVSSIKPSSLMAGKISGVGTIGLIQLGIWAAMAALMLHYRQAILGLFGVGGAGGFELPSVGLGTVLLLLVYFLLGYFFYASLYAAIGAMCNSEQEAQQAQTPIVLLLILPMVCLQVVANDPRSTISTVLTMLPFSAPVLMPMRFLLGGAPPAEVAASIAIMIVSIAGVVWVAARIYRVGILMYGKRPSLREIGRWLRY